MSSNRRDFLKTAAAGTTGIALAGSAMGMSAKSYSRVIGANDRLSVALMGCGRRVGAYYPVITNPKHNVDVAYICDVMKKQREKAAKDLSGKVSGKAIVENDIRKVFADKNVDVIFNATPDHWHVPGTWMALEAGKHVYLEKPCSHNPRENELLVEFQKKFGKSVQIGNQQRSANTSIEIIREIHNGVIGNPYMGVAFYTNNRGQVVNPVKAPVPEGLDWELFQGPAPRVDYMHDTWDYNWHWYGWNWGTAETGNNATHELDIAHWALQAKYPEQVDVKADKFHFPGDGWEMYDTMDATFTFPDNKIIKWDGKSRNGYNTFGSGRGTIIYGTEGTVYVDRGGYKLYDRNGKLVRERKEGSNEGGTALGGGGDITDGHVINLFDHIRGKAEKLTSPVEIGAVSQMMVHYANIAYRIGKSFGVNTETGHIYDREAMKLWSRNYQPGWEPKL